jgi:putative tricarboxylic transport membrane protein
MKRAENLAASIFIVLGLFVIKGATSLIYMTDIGPGPGFFPLWLGVLITSLGSILILQNTFSKKNSDTTINESDGPLWPGVAGAIRVGIVIFALLSVTFLITRIGFVMSMFILISTLLYTLGKQKVSTTLIVAFSGSFGVYFIFTKFLYVELPKATISWLSVIGL